MDCQHVDVTGYANNVGGYDYYCEDCGSLVERTVMQFPPQRKRWLQDGTLVLYDEPEETVWLGTDK